tara:strand:+ start:1177 stop:2562 length:1386 start_codon:yes stop_codon:yes gene_type:complete
MTDIITGNQLDIMAFDSGLTNDQQKEQLRGTRFADWVENRARDAVSYLQEASQDQEGWYDDALRLAGGGLKNVGWLAERPGIKQGLQILGAGGWAGGKLGGNLAESLGIDPRLGQWTGGLAGDAFTGGLFKKGAQIAKTTRQLNKLSPLQSGRLVTGGGFGAAPIGPRTQLGKLKTAATMRGSTRKAIDQAATRLVPDNQNVWNIKKRDIPQMKKQLGEWLDVQYKDKGSVQGIKRKDFGTIIVDGESREISGLTRYLEREGPLPDLPKVITRRQAKLRRIQREKPPTKEIRKLGRSKGLSTKEINEYMQEAQDSFASVQRAASRQGKRREFHAGHFYPAAKGGATSGRSAGIELGSLNISKGAKFEGTINLYAAKKAGIPTTWAEDMDMWIRIKKGKPVLEYKVAFTNAQRDLIESIPWHWSEEKVIAFFKKHKLDPKFNKNREQMKAITDELTINRRRY